MVLKSNYALKVGVIMNMEKLKEFFKNDTLAQTMGIEIEEAAFEKTICSMVVSDRFLNAKGSVHGGTIYSLADYTFAVASNLGGKLCVTLDANVTYFRPAKDNKLIATAVLVSSTKHTCNYNISVCDGQDRLVASVVMNGYRNDVDISFD